MCNVKLGTGCTQSSTAAMLVFLLIKVFQMCMCATADFDICQLLELLYLCCKPDFIKISYKTTKFLNIIKKLNLSKYEKNKAINIRSKIYKTRRMFLYQASMLLILLSLKNYLLNDNSRTHL